MSRLRTPLVILGLVGAVIVGVAVVLVVRVSRGTPAEILVAKRDLEPGTAVEPGMFQVEVRGLTPGPLSTYVTKDEYLAHYNGLPTLMMVNKGSPLMKAHLPDPDGVDGLQARQHRLTLLLDDADHVVYPLPVSVEQVGNFVVAGDYIDVVFTLGRAAASTVEHIEEVPAPTLEAPRSTRTTTPTVPVTVKAAAVEHVTSTLTMPVSKVILPNVHVLRVERERIRSASATYATSSETRTTTEEGDIVRLYVELSREDVEVLSFALHNGALNLPARAQESDAGTTGYFWEDFVDDLFLDRPEAEICGAEEASTADCLKLKKDQ
jgi:Flp pilus assembly protein CpaB